MLRVQIKVSRVFLKQDNTSLLAQSCRMIDFRPSNRARPKIHSRVLQQQTPRAFVCDSIERVQFVSTILYYASGWAHLDSRSDPNRAPTSSRNDRAQQRMTCRLLRFVLHRCIQMLQLVVPKLLDDIRQQRQ